MVSTMTDFLPPLLWAPSPNLNSRGGCKIDQIIIHYMEGSFGGSVASFDETASHVSAHLCVRDDGQAVDLVVAYANRAWHACDFNSRSIGIEMAGYSKNGFSDAEKLTTARICAHLCHRFGIPIRRAKGGVGPGIESHWGLGRAGGGHSDPSTAPDVDGGLHRLGAGGIGRRTLSDRMGAGRSGQGARHA
jgi:N-acetylmuramoyl-L-alanine amidase-like protein